MTRRALVLLALVALAACGSGDDPAIQAEGSTTSSPGAGEGGLSLSLQVPEPLVAGEPVTWQLVVSNEGDEGVVLAFTSGQQGDVVLRDAKGAEALRWSEGMMFSQVLTDVPLPAGDQVTFELPGTLDVEPGTYELEATVPSEPAPPPLTMEVTVTE